MHYNCLYKNTYARAEVLNTNDTTIRVYTFAPYMDFTRVVGDNGFITYEKMVVPSEVEPISANFGCIINGVLFHIERIRNNRLQLIANVSLETINEFKEKLRLDIKFREHYVYELEVSFSQIDQFAISYRRNGKTEQVEVTKGEFLEKYRIFNARPRENELYRYMRNQYGLSELRAIENLEKLAPYYEIMNEFQYTCNTGRMVEDDEKPVTIQGYTAKKLVDTTYLNPLGAYNYLIYLDKKPNEALAALKAGLPRK